MARQARLQLAQDALGRPLGDCVLAAGDEQHDLGSGGLALGRRGDRARHDGARAALGGREHPSAPALLRRHVRVRARDEDAAAGVRGRRRARRRARIISSALDIWRPSTRVQEGARGLLRGARRRADALDLGGDERRHEPDKRRARLRASAHPQLADRLVGDAQLDRVDAGGAVEQRALVGRRARGDGQDRAGAIEQDEARLEHPRGGADDIGQSGARFDRLRDGVQSSKIEPQGPFGGAGHRHRLRGDAVPVVRDGSAARCAEQEQRDEDEQREEPRREPLPGLAVRRPRRKRDEARRTPTARRSRRSTPRRR